MRFTQVYILRLLVDSNYPGHLQGVLAPVGDNDQSHPFQNGQTLLDLLCCLAAQQGDTQSTVEPIPAKIRSHQRVDCSFDQLITRLRYFTFFPFDK
jgi:hypothetical protein